MPDAILSSSETQRLFSSRNAVIASKARVCELGWRGLCAMMRAMSDTDCLFCRILAGTAAADVVYQDNRCVVIRDVNPQAPTHLLVIPREHLESLDDATQKDESLLGHLLRMSARVANDHGLSENGGYRAVINTGRGAGQSVFHLHVHVLGGREMAWPPG